MVKSLEVIEKEIVAILDREGVAATLAIANEDEARMTVTFPEWSMIRFVDGALQLRPDSQPDKQGESIQILFILSDATTVAANGLAEVSDQVADIVRKMGGKIERQGG